MCSDTPDSGRGLFSSLFKSIEKAAAALEFLVFSWASSIVPPSLADELRILFALYCVGH
jgi:hypothetical protein